ncbi:ADIPOR/PROGESTIN RECEPTOR-RELATED [Salix purpurea]|uniref:ADIPOR/PROGESTIN RECEPTOR-RELATED n=1 Tax=Salix purpurea TaxID=77065 RepID=A0A9Q0UKL5_SALPP|nr:ADIPOR/PROGESTIN RECEPTOR-RELATED [Salix purpurea]
MITSCTSIKFIFTGPLSLIVAGEVWFVDLKANSMSIFTSEQRNVSKDSRDIYLGRTEQLDLGRNSSMKMDVSSLGMPATRWPFYIFLGGSMICLLSSSICHLFCCHSHNLNILLMRMDYVGIVIMIITSFFPPIYYIFQCEQLWQFIYLGEPSCFASMGLFGLVPAVHSVIANWSNPRRDTIVAYESAMAVFYLSGAGLYVARFPERLKPGLFDLAGHSHQIFHVLVVLGALAHYGATLLFLEYRDLVGCELRQSS